MFGLSLNLGRAVLYHYPGQAVRKPICDIVFCIHMFFGSVFKTSDFCVLTCVF